MIHKWLSCNNSLTTTDLNVSILEHHEIYSNNIDNLWLIHIDKLWHKLNSEQRKSISDNSSSWSELRKKLEQINGPGVICHGDIHPGNIIKNKYLIDWEWCCIAPPEYDLAMIKQFVSKENFNSLIKAYPRKINFKILDQCYKLCLFRCAIWALSRTNKNCKNESIKTIEQYRFELTNNCFVYNEDNLQDLASAAIIEYNS